MCYFIQYVYEVCTHAATPVIAYKLCDDKCCLQPGEFDAFRRENTIRYPLSVASDVERIIINAACRACQEGAGFVHDPYDNSAFEIYDIYEQKLMRDAVWLMPVADVTNDQFRTIDFSGSRGENVRLLTKDEAGNTSPRTCSHNDTDTDEGNQSVDESSEDESDIFYDAEYISAGSSNPAQPERISRMAYLAQLIARLAPRHLDALPLHRPDSPDSVTSEEAIHIPRNGRLRSIDARVSLLPSALRLPARRERGNVYQVSPFELNDVQFSPPSSGSLKRHRGQTLELLESGIKSARVPELGRRDTKELEDIWSPGNTQPDVEDPKTGSEAVAGTRTDTPRHVKSLPLPSRRSTSSPVAGRPRPNSSNLDYNPWMPSPQEPSRQTSQQPHPRDSTSSASSSSSLSSLGLSSSSPLAQLTPLSRTPSPSLTVKPLFNSNRDKPQVKREDPSEPDLRQRHTPTSQTESYPPPPRVDTEPDISVDQDSNRPLHHTTPTAAAAVAVQRRPTYFAQAKKMLHGMGIEFRDHLQECLLCWLTILMFLIVLYNGGY